MVSKNKGKKQGDGRSGVQQQGEYRLEDGVRHVEPYIFTHSTHAKGRWYGREVLEVVTTEFGSQPRAYWVRALASGAVRVNDTLTAPGYRFKGGDLFTHKTHRHEPPGIATPATPTSQHHSDPQPGTRTHTRCITVPSVMGSVTLVADTPDILAVCKPPSMPMHPCGAYRDNSLVHVLKREPLLPGNSPPLHLVHRLDRVTSGVVVMAKSQTKAASMAEQIRDKETCKVYLARVKGRFPCPLRLAQLRVITDEGALLSVEDHDLDDGVAGTKHKRGVGESNVAATKRSRLEREAEAEEGGEKEEKYTTRLTNPAASPPPPPPVAKEGSEPATHDVATPTPSHIKVAEVPSFETLAASEAVGVGWVDLATHPQCSRYTAHWHTSTPTHTHTGAATAAAAPVPPTSMLAPALVLRCPLGVVSFRNGNYACMPDGRECVSMFRTVGNYDEHTDTTLVECRPVTGRTHQLRLHLQLLGCSIANDPCYGGRLFYCEDAKLALAKETLQTLRAKGLRPLSKVPHLLADGDDGDGDDYLVVTQKDVDEEELEVGGDSAAAVAARAALLSRPGESEEMHIARICRYCQSEEAVRLETMLHCDGIWLHAQMYCKPAKSAAGSAAVSAEASGEYSSSSAQWGPFEAPLPPWAAAFVDVHP